jgi:hypothetical protein
LNPKKSQVIFIQKEGDYVLQPELFIGLDSIEVVPRDFKKFGFCSEQEFDTRGSL